MSLQQKRYRLNYYLHTLCTLSAHSLHTVCILSAHSLHSLCILSAYLYISIYTVAIALVQHSLCTRLLLHSFHNIFTLEDIMLLTNVVLCGKLPLNRAVLVSPTSTVHEWSETTSSFHLLYNRSILTSWSPLFWEWMWPQRGKLCCHTLSHEYHMTITWPSHDHHMIYTV